MEQYCRALAETFACDIVPIDGPIVLHFENGRELNIAFDQKQATLSSPLPEAHEGISETAMRRLLALNFVSSDLGGSWLRRRENQDFLELINIVPLASVEPRDFAELAAHQADASARLEQTITQFSDE